MENVNPNSAVHEHWEAEGGNLQKAKIGPAGWVKKILSGGVMSDKPGGHGFDS